MLTKWPIRLVLRYRPTCACQHVIVRHASSSSAGVSTARTRNIGIIAHIDAGKTTTTERMLYYSGFTRRLGDVDEGSTVTDFLPAERARGITIQSAAITFQWPPVESAIKEAEDKSKLRRSSLTHNINLIDTPGHADFTFEVLRSLRILDGAVCILDGVAGVEAQTEKVWTQASVYHIPRIIFVNKLDRDGAAFAHTVHEIGSRLNCWPAVCQIPWWNSDGQLQGVADVLGLKALLYPSGGDGKNVQSFNLDELAQRDATLAQELRKARTALVELLSEHDDEMVESFLEANEDHIQISQTDIVESLRRCTTQSPQTVVPVFAGASFRNVGVQPLLDAVVDLLPSPEERPDPEVGVSSTTLGLHAMLSGKASLPGPKAPSKGGKASAKALYNIQNLEGCALAFKVVSDPKRGVLVYVRVYSGTIKRGAQLFNTNLQLTEKAPRLMQMYANDAVEVSEIGAGQIGVITGLKAARTGDTLIVYTGANPKTGPPAPLNSLQLRPIVVPPPVFFISVESQSLSEERHIAETLNLLLREDPSLQVMEDLESGQTQLAGMGELHLEIATDRLINELKAKATIGSIQIGYRETSADESPLTPAIFDREIAGKAAKAGCTASVSPADARSASHDEESTQFTTSSNDDNHLTVLTPSLDEDGAALEPEGRGLPGSLPIRDLYTALQTGVAAALARGPSHGYAVHSTHVTLTFDPATDLFSNTTPAAISSAARMAVTAALRAVSSSTVLMEPVMHASISVDEASLGSVVHDLSSARGGQIISLDAEADEMPSDLQTSSSDTPLVDVRRIYAPPDPFGSTGTSGSSGDGGEGGGGTRMRTIIARVPLKEMVGYLKHLRSLTAGRGTFVMSVDRFERMSAPRMKAVLGRESEMEY